VEEKTFLFLSEDVESELERKGTEISQILLESGLSSSLSTDPSKNSNRTREPVTVILASAGAIMAATPTISKLINAVLRRSLVVEEVVLAPVEDNLGNVVKDAHGEPITAWVSKKRLLESDAAPKTSVNLEGPTGIKISLSET
jgi:hypothetical protein